MNYTTRKKVLAIFASGAGTNAQKIISYFKNHPAVKVGLIVSNKPDAGVLTIARKEDIPFIVIEKARFRETGYTDELAGHGVDWIILAGFLWKVPEVLIRKFPSRIINIHPALLPAYGGKGMYGMAVHTAVVEAGETRSGITIHFVDEEYDHGAVILQSAIELAADETPESLAGRIHELEYLHFAPTIEKIVTNEEGEASSLSNP